jgi:hypothetical protein
MGGLIGRETCSRMLRIARLSIALNSFAIMAKFTNYAIDTFTSTLPRFARQCDGFIPSSLSIELEVRLH